MKSPFVLTSSLHGTMIVPINDWTPDVLGVGAQLLKFGVYDNGAIILMTSFLDARRREYGDGVVMIDGGANIGCFSVTFGRYMETWGTVLAFEAQDQIFYALCGNLAINNIMNVRAFHCALARQDGTIEFPVPDYSQLGNFGGVSVTNKNDIGQKLKHTRSVPTKQIDLLNLPRLDLLKLDIEGMEIDALTGAQKTIERCKPFIMAEHFITGLRELEWFLTDLGYEMVSAGGDVFAAYGKNEVIGKMREAKRQQESIAA